MHYKIWKSFKNLPISHIRVGVCVDDVLIHFHYLADDEVFLIFDTFQMEEKKNHKQIKFSILKS